MTDVKVVDIWVDKPMLSIEQSPASTDFGIHVSTNTESPVVEIIANGTSLSADAVFHSKDDIDAWIELYSKPVAASDTYKGPYTVTPRARDTVVLPTNNKVMKGNVKVLKIPYYETSNVSDGYTVYIGEIE